MIDRYTTARMRNIWSPKHRWDLFLNVELAYLVDPDSRRHRGARGKPAG